MRLGLLCLAVACLLAASASTVLALNQQRQMLNGQDDFEDYGDEFFVPLYRDTDGTPGIDPNTDWMTWGGAPTTPTAGKWAKVTLEPESTNHVAWVCDSNETANSQLYSNIFEPLNVAPYGRDTGTFEVTTDVKPIAGTFKINLTTGATPTTGGNWIVGVGFGGENNAYFPNATNGQYLILQTKQGGTGFPSWTTTAVGYSRDTWYSLKFFVDVDNELYQFWFGERGGALSQVTSGWTGWITQQTANPETLGGIFLATSNATSADSGELYVDNVVCVPEPASILGVLTLAGLVPALRRRR